RLPSGPRWRLRRAGARARGARLGQHVAGRRTGRPAPRLRAHGALHHGRRGQARPMAGRARGGSGGPTGREPEARADGRARARARGPGAAGAAVVMAVGPWRELTGAALGLRFDTIPIRHQLWVTAPMDGIAREMPVVRVPDASVYLRPEVGGVLIGGLESAPKRFAMADLP